MPEAKYNKNDVFFVIDFDRTLGDTDKFHEVLEIVIEQETGIQANALRSARLNAEAAGSSFDTVDYLRSFLARSGSEKTWQHIQQIFIARAKTQDMREPHASDLLRILDQKQIPYGIITFGGEAWQLAKIEGAHMLQVPHIVTHIQEKGKILTGWKTTAGDFIVPPALTRDFQPLKVRTIVFLDDKSVSFYQIPPGVRGIRVRPPEGLKLPAQIQPLPAGVEEVDGVQGAIRLLFGEMDEAHY